MLLDIPIGKEKYKDEFKKYENINEKISLFEEKYKENIINDDVDKNNRITEKYNETNLSERLKRIILKASEESADSFIKVGAGIGIGKTIQVLAKTSVKSIIINHINMIFHSNFNAFITNRKYCCRWSEIIMVLS